MTPRAERIIALLAGGLLSLIFVSCSAVNVAGWTTGSVERSDHRVIPGPVSELRIRAAGGDVTVIPASDGDITIDSRARGSLHTPRLDVDFDGDSVDVQGGCPEVSFGHCQATLIVRVPPDTAVRVDATSGDLSATGMTGNAVLHTASGDVRARGLSGRVELDTNSGDVQGSDLRSTAVRGHTASGDIDLDFARAPQMVDADTGSGDVRIAVPQDGQPYIVDVDTGSGEETVDVPRDARAPRVLRADTGSGDIELTYSGS